MRGRNRFLYYLRGLCLTDENIKRLQRLLLTVSLVFWGAVARAKGELADTYITEWREGAIGAYSFTFDDGADGQWQYAVPILNESSIHATFFLIGASVEAWYSTVGCIHVPQMLYIAATGHEIGCHTYNHLNLVNLNDVDVHAQMSLNQHFFNSYGINPVSMAYPYSATNERVQAIVEQYIEFARDGVPRVTNSSSWEELNPLDLKWSSGGDGGHYACIDVAVATRTWAIGVFHQIGIEGGPTVEEFLALVQYIAARRDAGELWVDTVREIACYIRERSAAVITKRYDAGNKTITVVLQVDLGYPYIVPLTLRTSINDYFVKSINQSEMPILYEVINEETGRVVQYDVVPNGGYVAIELTDETLEQ